jgi:hypothetical protein
MGPKGVKLIFGQTGSFYAKCNTYGQELRERKGLCFTSPLKSRFSFFDVRSLPRQPCI